MSGRFARLAAISVAIGLGTAQMALAGDPAEDAASPTLHTVGSRVDITGGTHDLKAGAGGAVFDAEGNYNYNIDVSSTTEPFSGAPCMHPLENGVSPVVDGSNTFGNDAFDGGLYLEVNHALFNAKEGSVKGQQLKVTDSLKGFRVVRYERALKAYPTLRSYITFTNTEDRSRGLTATIDSAMGADDTEATRGSSDGNKRFTKADRWFAASDSASSPSDPPILFVLSGKGAPGVSKIIWSPDSDSSAICQGAVVYSYHFSVPGHSTVALLIFTELWDSNNHAVKAGSKYDKPSLPGKLLTGLSPLQRNRVVNWNL